MNARDAMPDGGKLVIMSGPAPNESGMVQLSIADTGTGIPADVLPKLFDIFFTTKTSGTGLGLWLAYRTLREHSGKIEVESKPGQGTKFTLTLPVPRDQLGITGETIAGDNEHRATRTSLMACPLRAASTVEMAHQAEEFMPETILIVDDETEMADTAPGSCERAGSTAWWHTTLQRRSH
jgi:hypothetical protein